MRIFLSNNEMNLFQYKSAYTDNMTCRSSHRRCSAEKGVLKNFVNFTGKRLSWSVFLIKFVKNFVKQRLQHRHFPLKFAKFLRRPILKNIYERLLLYMRWSAIQC